MNLILNRTSRTEAHTATAVDLAMIKGYLEAMHKRVL